MKEMKVTSRKTFIRFENSWKWFIRLSENQKSNFVKVPFISAQAKLYLFMYLFISLNEEHIRMRNIKIRVEIKQKKKKNHWIIPPDLIIGLHTLYDD